MTDMTPQQAADEILLLSIGCTDTARVLQIIQAQREAAAKEASAELERQVAAAPHAPNCSKAIGYKRVEKVKTADQFKAEGGSRTSDFHYIAHVPTEECDCWKANIAATPEPQEGGQA